MTMIIAAISPRNRSEPRKTNTQSSALVKELVLKGDLFNARGKCTVGVKASVHNPSAAQPWNFLVQRWTDGTAYYHPYVHDSRLSPKFQRDAYRAAIDKVRSEHASKITPAHFTTECPRCNTKQVLTDAPGMRVCMKCGFEFRPRRLDDRGSR